jgi:hypothetical protein
MRDPARISRIMGKLQKKWEEYPNLRLGQLLFHEFDGIWDTTELRFFLLEDDKFEQRLDGEIIEVR